MTSRAWIGIAAIALLGCKGSAPARRDAPPPLDAAVLVKPARALQLTIDPEAGTRRVTATALVVVREDGAMTVLATPAGDALDVDALPDGEAATLDELAAKTGALQPADAGPPLPKPGADLDLPCPARELEGGSNDFGGGWGGGISTFGGHGIGKIGEEGRARRTLVGLLGRSLVPAVFCGDRTPLVLVDARASAHQLLAVLRALPRATIAVSTDDGAHARTLPIELTYVPGTDGAIDEVEVDFVVKPDTVVDGTKTYPPGVARLRLDGNVPAGVLIAAVARLLAAGVADVGLGEPEYVVEGGASPGVGGGRGPMRKRDAKVPRVTLGKPSLTGGGDPAVVRRYLRRNLPKVTYCYERTLVVRPTIEGTVAAQFLIQPTGHVAGVKVDGVDREVAACISGVLAGIDYPKPDGTEGVVVSVSIELHPSGG